MSTRTIKASDLFVKALENEGVEYIFGIPGEENLDFLESLRESKITLILTRHEQAAAFMAATYGRLLGKVGVCLSTLGPGATNLVTGAAYASLGAMPMLMITGQKPIKKSKQGMFQIIDTVAMMTPLTKYAHQIVNVNNIPTKVREAFRIALEERPGPVHLELPEDVAAERTEHSTPLLYSEIPRRPIAAGEAIDTAIKMIRNAKSPILLVGAGANRKWIHTILEEFINKTSIPFVNTQMGKGVIGGNHPLFLGTTALSDGDYVHDSIDHADLIINAGHDIIEKPPFFMKGDKQRVIHVNFFSANVDQVYFPQHQVVGDIGNSFKRMTEKLNVNPEHDFKKFSEIKKEMDENLYKRSKIDHFPLKPQRIVHDVREVLPSDSILTLDNGMYKIWFARHYRACRPNSILLDNALATMGAGLPSAMMAAIIYPNKPIVAVCGDGGFMMNSQELETCKRLGLNLTVIILKDDSYGMIKWKQAGMGFKDFGLDYGNPDFVKYAESYGLKGFRVKQATDFAKLLKKCIESKGTQLLEVPIDYSDNVKVLIDDLKKRKDKKNGKS